MGYNASGEFTLKFKALADKEKAEFIEKAGKDGYTGETFREIVEDILHEAYCFTFSKWTLGQAGKTSLVSGYRENTTYREDDFTRVFRILNPVIESAVFVFEGEDGQKWRLESDGIKTKEYTGMICYEDDLVLKGCAPYMQTLQDALTCYLLEIGKTIDRCALVLNGGEKDLNETAEIMHSLKTLARRKEDEVKAMLAAFKTSAKTK